MLKKRIIGSIATLAISGLGFLAHSFVSSLETKADATSKYVELNQKVDRVDHKLDLALCYLEKKHCLKQGDR